MKTIRSRYISRAFRLQFKNCPNSKWTHISHFQLANGDVKQQINGKKYHFHLQYDALFFSTIARRAASFLLLLKDFLLLFFSSFGCVSFFSHSCAVPICNRNILNKTFETMKILLLTHKLKQSFFKRKTKQWRQKMRLKEKSPDERWIVD